MLQYIRSFFSKNKKNILFIGLFLTFFFFSYSSGYATGDEPVLKPEDAEKVVKILNGFIMWAAALMWMVTSFITIFLYPGWVNGTIFGLDGYLKEIWILVSNVVYFIFAFILIAIAFMNIIGKGEWTWELKQAMPKFIAWVLIVPFSWFFIQLVLSVSSVLTIGVLTLPYDSFQWKEEFEAALDDPLFSEQKICKDIVISFDGEFDGEATELNSWGSDSQLNENVKCKSDDSKVTVREILTGRASDGSASAEWGALQNSIFGIMSIYTYGILRVHELDTITWNDLESLKTIADLIFKIVFDLLFIIVYLLLMVALLLALFTRWIRLWIYAMLSPVFWLLYFFGKGSEWFGSDSNKFSISEFIALALVPVYVSAALAFGLVFILVASHGIKETNPDSDTLRAGWFSLTILGAHGDGESEKSVIWKLIVEIFGIVILWIAVMFALRQSEVTKQITQPIADFGKSVGDLAAKSPTYAPILPSSMWWSVAGFGQMWKSVTSWIEQHMIWKWSAAAKPFLPDNSWVDASTAARQAMSTLNANGANNRDTVSQIREAVESAGSVESVANNRELVRLLQQYLEKSNMPNKPEVRFQDQASVTAALWAIDEYVKRTGWIGDFIVGEDLTARSSRTEVNNAIWWNRRTPSAWQQETPPAGWATTNTFTFNATTHIGSDNKVTDRGIDDIVASLREWRTEITETEASSEVRRMLSTADSWVDRNDAISRVLTELDDFVKTT